MKTTRGIYNDLKESDYSYNFEGLTFFFSSKKYQEKFKNNVKEYVINERIKNYVKYKVHNSFEIYYAISFYKKIEKRGFRIIANNKELNENTIICNRLEVI